METKKKKILWLELAGFMFTLVAGTVMHFGLELSSFSRALAWLFPVNESPWEHLKLSFYPVVFWGLIQYAILRRNRNLSPSAPGGVRNVWFARLLGTYVAIMTTVVSWSLQYWLMGRSILAIDIAMMYGGLLASALLCWRLLTGPTLRHPRRLSQCGFAGLALLMFCFCLFTYCVPRQRLWMDRKCESFGIIEVHVLFDRHLTTHCPDPAVVPSLPGFCGFVPLALIGGMLVVCLTAGRNRKHG